MTEVFRTPDERFVNLPGYDFAPNYVDVDGLRMHYVDEGPRDGRRSCVFTASRAGRTSIARCSVRSSTPDTGSSYPTMRGLVGQTNRPSGAGTPTTATQS